MVTSKFFRHKPKNPHFTPTSVSDPPGGAYSRKGCVHTCMFICTFFSTNFICSYLLFWMINLSEKFQRLFDCS